MQGKDYISYNDAINDCGIEELTDRRQNHCLKFAQSLSECEHTSALIPPTRRELHGRELRNAANITQLKCRTSRFRGSPIPYFIDLLNSNS